jgi:YD repeat-containing protein
MVNLPEVVVVDGLGGREAAVGEVGHLIARVKERRLVIQFARTYTAYLLASSTDLATASYYAVEVSNPTVDATGCWAPTRFYKRVGGLEYELMSFTQFCRYNGQNRFTLRAYARPGMQLIWTSPTSAYPYFDNDQGNQNGRSGLALANTPAGNSATQGRLYHGEFNAPPSPDGSTVATALYSDRVELQWRGVSDGVDGSGVLWYIIYRDGNYIGSGITPEFTDNNVQPDTTYNYTLSAQDNNGNYGNSTTVQVRTAPANSVFSRRIGVRANGAYWGSGGEQIDIFTGNLNYTLPLFKAQARGGWGATFALAYNSQMWHKESGGVWRSGGDVGYGYGWRLLAGAVVPSWRDSWVLDHYTYLDSTGAEYRLDRQMGDGTWMSSQGTYVAFHPLEGRLYFPDGGFWQMGCMATGQEEDAGTYYPTLMQDTNGNQLVVRYYPGSGVPDGDTSSRIWSIQDVRGGAVIGSYNGLLPPAKATYEFLYDWTQAVPHLLTIRDYIPTGGTYTFAYTHNQTLYEPFTNTAYGGAVSRLDGVTNTLGTHALTYNGSLEMLTMTTPMGGRLRWEYRTWTYTGARSFRELWLRYQRSTPTAAETYHQIWNDTSNGAENRYHAYAAVADWDNAHQRVWDFYGPGPYFGLVATDNQRQGPDWNPRIRHQYYYSNDNGQPYVYRHQKITDWGQSYGTESNTYQVLDYYGNVTASWTTDANGNVKRSYSMSYLSAANYTNLHIRNRLVSASVTAGGVTTPLANIQYDVGYGCSGIGVGLVDKPDAQYYNTLELHDAAYGIAWQYRGNPVVRYDAGIQTCVAHEKTGAPHQRWDALGRSVKTETTGATNFSLPGQIRPNDSSYYATTISYNAAFQVSSVTGAEGNFTSVGYDPVGRPVSATGPKPNQYQDGPVTVFTYPDNNRKSRR